MHHSFSRLCGNAVFSATMSLNMFKFLLAHLRFDAKATIEERWKQDCFATMRDILQIFTGNCERVLLPEVFMQHALGWHLGRTIRTNLQNMDYSWHMMTNR